MIDVVEITSRNYTFYSLMHKEEYFWINGWQQFNTLDDLLEACARCQLQKSPNYYGIETYVVNKEIIASFPNLNKLRKMKESYPEYFI